MGPGAKLLLKMVNIYNHTLIKTKCYFRPLEYHHKCDTLDTWIWQTWSEIYHTQSKFYITVCNIGIKRREKKKINQKRQQFLTGWESSWGWESLWGLGMGMLLSGLYKAWGGIPGTNGAENFCSHLPRRVKFCYSYGICQSHQQKSHMIWDMVGS